MSIPIIGEREQPPKPQNGNNRDLTRGTLPIIAVIALATAVAAGAYQVGMLIEGLRVDKLRTSERFSAVETQLVELKSLVLSGCTAPTHRDRYRDRDVTK